MLNEYQVLKLYTMTLNDVRDNGKIIMDTVVRILVYTRKPCSYRHVRLTVWVIILIEIGITICVGQCVVTCDTKIL